VTIATRSRQTATRANRARQLRAETRMDEIVKVAGIPDGYERADRSGNLAVESAFARVYQAVDTDEERSAVARVFVAWQSDERTERLIVQDLAADSVEVLKAGNPLFIDGAFTPSGSDGAA